MANELNNEYSLLSEMTINGILFKIKDTTAQSDIQDIASAIISNNTAIGTRINELNTRLTAIESNTIDDTRLDNIEDAINDYGYATATSLTNLNNKLNNINITLATSINDLDNRLDILENGNVDVDLSEIEETIEDMSHIISASLTDLDNRLGVLENGNVDVDLSEIEQNIEDMSYAISLSLTDLNTKISGCLTPLTLSSNLKTINNQSIIGEGNLNIAPTLDNLVLPNDYEPSDLSNEDLEPQPGDTFEEAISKMHKALLDFEEVDSLALNDLDVRIIELSNSIPTDVSDLNNDSGFINEIKTINNTSLIGTGNITINGEANVIEGVSFNGSTATITNKIATITSHLDKIPLVNTVASSTLTIDPYKLYSLGTVSSSVTITFNTQLEVSGYVAEYSIKFVAGQNCEINLPNGCIYNGGSAPTFTLGHTYEININDNLVVVGEFY